MNVTGASYLDDDDFRGLQNLLMLQPEAGDSIPGTGGLRKLRFADARRGKGKRGGLRVIYYWRNLTQGENDEEISQSQSEARR